MAARSEIPFSSSILSSLWNDYRDWAAFARKQKNSLFFWRKIVLSLGLGGAVLETLAVSNVGNSFVVGNVNIFGLTGFISLALAAFLGRHALGGHPEMNWVATRSVAEALKSEAFKYCLRIPPYDQGDRDQKLTAMKKKIAASTDSVPMIPMISERSEKPPPNDGMDVDEYIATRINEQIDPINGYYWKAARENQDKVKKFKGAALVVGAISAILGGFGALNVLDAAIWVATLTTLSTSLAAYFQAGRFEYLVMSYSATARRLRNIIDEWKANPNHSEIQSFVLKSEETISFENNSWLAEWLKETENKEDQGH
jgi:hypothetical protein